MPMAWPTGAPTRLGSVALGLVVRQLAHLTAERAVRVHDALGVGRRARGVADQRRASGSTATGPPIGSAPRSVVEGDVLGPVVAGVADHEDHLEVAAARRGWWPSRPGSRACRYATR